MGLIFESFFQDLVLVLVALVTLAMYKLRGVWRFFDEAGLKHDVLWTQLYANMKLMSGKLLFLDFMDDIYKNWPGESAIGYLQIFNPVVMVRDPDLAQKILIKDFTSFHDHQLGDQLDITTNPLEGHLFNMCGGEWRALRNRLSPVFTSGRLRNMYPQIQEKTERLVKALPKGKEIAIRDYLSRFAIDVIGSTAFGLESGTIENPNSELKRMANKIFKPSYLLIAKTILRLLAPKLVKIMKIRMFDKDIQQFFFSITKQAFNYRVKTGERRGDFVDLLLQLRGRGKLEFETSQDPDGEIPEADETVSELILTDELLTAQSFIFLVAGWETSTSAMNYTLYFLAKHQHIQDTLRRELKKNKIKDYESLRAAKYLDACISESMRIEPPGGALLRICNKDYSFGKARIKKDTVVIVNSYSMQRDPQYFEDPLEYRPERFLEGEDSRTPGAFTPFGAGPRICIAERFAKMEVRMLVARLVENFKIKLSPKTQEPVKRETGFINDIKGGLWVILEELKDE